MANKFQEYTNVRAVNEVLGALLQRPTLIKQYQLTQTDFSDKFHRLVFATISNLHNSGVSNIDGVAMDEYLSHYESQHEMFKRYNGVEFVDRAKDAAMLDNIKYYVDQVKKFSLLRRFAEEGMDVSRYFDPKEIDPYKIEEKRKRLDEETLTDIINHYRRTLVNVTAPFTVSESRESKHAGDGGAEQKELWKRSVAWGIGYSSAYMTTILHGMQPTTFTLKSAGSGVGKTRTAIGDMCYACSPRYYDPVRNEWMQNPNGLHNKALYIGTEMDLMREIEPIMWSYLADVPEDHIKYNAYALGEEARVDKAIEVLRDESHIELVYLPEYSVQALTDVIEEYVLNHGTKYVFFDYIHTNPELINEFQRRASSHMAIREDQVLLDLSTQLKRIAKEYRICINSATQVNRSFRDEGIRDQTLIAGATSIVNKADNAMIASIPTQKEFELVQPILQQLDCNRRPNLVYSVYKTRGSKWKNVKVWLYVDYSTMRTHDMFVTDYDYNLLDIEKTYINVNSDVMASTSKAHSAVATVRDDIEDAQW